MRVEFDDLRAQQALTTIPLRSPLPWSSASLSANTILHVLFELRARKCRHVVECGSGLSTVYIAWMLKHLGSGRIYSIEHEERWADIVQQLIDENALTEYATIVRAPLSPQEYGTRTVKWYSIDALKEVLSLSQIDMLLVDGPPQKISRFSRYPAVPVFYSRLHPDSIVFLDDTRTRMPGSRRGEAKHDTERIPDMWCEEFPLTANQYGGRHGHTVFGLRSPEKNDELLVLTGSLSTTSS